MVFSPWLRPSRARFKIPALDLEYKPSGGDDDPSQRGSDRHNPRRDDGGTADAARPEHGLRNVGIVTVIAI